METGGVVTMMEVRISCMLMGAAGAGPWGLLPAPTLPIRLASTGGSLAPPGSGEGEAVPASNPSG